MDIKKIISSFISDTTKDEKPLTEEQLEIIGTKVQREIGEAKNKPFIVSIMGQTGVGKSSLLNALFNTALKTDPVRPCTKSIEKIVTKGTSGHELWFYDLPGIGESDKADTEYISHYRQKLLDSDVVLWALHADSRSVTFDIKALNILFKNFDRRQQAQLMSKITFVLTKVDLITPSPWILAKTNEQGKFVPSKPIKALLEQKALYYQDEFIRPHAELIVSETYNNNNFNISVPQLSCDKYAIRYQGIMDGKTLNVLKTKYPEHVEVFDRLYSNYEVIPCSSLFRYNLYQLVVVIINKLGLDAVTRFNNFYNNKSLNNLSLKEAKQFCNLIIFDSVKNRKLFDINEFTI